MMIVKSTILYLVIQTILTFGYPTCPDICYCSYDFTDCKYNDLTTLPSNIEYNVTSLDLSHNNFQQFPNDLRLYKNLKYLNLSYNKISVLEHSALDGLGNLEKLDFTFNAFCDWADIKSQAFSTTDKLNFLDFSHNPLRSIPIHSNPLKVKSLEILKLNNCSMRNLYGNIFDKLPSIKELHISYNPISYINGTFTSNTLKFLDISYCNLKYINHLAIFNLTALETIWLQKNRDLKNFSCSSHSLLYLDISDCNLETIPKGFLKNMYFANFHGNHFRTIPLLSFIQLTNLKILDLSYNAISLIEENAFSGLNNIEIIDLSFNTLTHLSKGLFSSNLLLTNLNLSHNYFNKIEKFAMQSLENLDLGSCEIQLIEKDCLKEMPNLKVLNLSKNVISTIPNELVAVNLEFLDLSLCHIKNLNNKTFAAMLSLRNINLSGNRLTTANPDYFFQIISLEIYDNPWRCDCSSLKEMYFWLVKTGKNTDKLICQSPEKFEGLSWLSACQIEWHPEINRKDQMWWYSVGLMATMFILLFVIITIRKMNKLKEKRLREADDIRRVEELENLRRMQRVQLEIREEISRNAPDPREIQTPPSYNEALLLPRLDASHPSLSGSLHSVTSTKHTSNPDILKRNRRRKRRRRKGSLEGQRVSRITINSDTSDQETQPRTTLESDF